MFGFLGRLFSSNKAVEEGVSAISNGIDKLFYTSEEKAENEMKVRQKAGELLVSWMGATQGQNIARRLLAIMIAFTWLFMYLIAAGLNVCVVWFQDPVLVQNLQSSAKIIGERATEMNGAMMLILGFYFAAPHMSSIVNVAMERFAGNKQKSKVSTSDTP